MRAMRYHRQGDPAVLCLEEVPDPAPGAAEALVRVRACGVNRIDISLRSGRTTLTIPLPHIPGSEVAGEVVSVGGSDAAGLEPGTRVAIAPWIFCGHCRACLEGQETLCDRGDILGRMSDGGYAELVRVPAWNLVPLPDGLAFEHAAAHTLATLTAWHLLMTRARIHAGEDVLVLAGGSGIGSAAIQIARLAGARVIATAGSAAKCEQARQLGADAVINHSAQDIADETRRLTGGRGVDLVVEHVGTATWSHSVDALAKGGRLATCGATTGGDGPTDIRRLFGRQLTLIGSMGGTRSELRTVLDLAARGSLRPVIDRVLPLAAAAEAHRAMEAGELFGKAVLVL